MAAPCRGSSSFRPPGAPPGQGAVAWVGALLAAGLLALGLLAGAGEAGRGLGETGRAVVCALAGGDGCGAAPAVRAGPAEGAAEREPTRLRARSFAARGVSAPAAPRPAQAIRVGDDDACAGDADPVEVCLGTDGLVAACARRDGRAFCDRGGVEADALACGPSPSALRADAASSELVCELATRSGRTVLLRCVDGRPRLAGCADTALDAFARPARTGIDPASCQGQAGPRPRADDPRGDPIRAPLETRRGITTVRTTVLCRSWAGGAYACWDVAATSGDGWSLVPVDPVCDNRSPDPRLLADCRPAGPPRLDLCRSRDGTPLRCVALGGRHHHCATDAPSRAFRTLGERCPGPRRRLGHGGSPSSADLSLAFCAAVAPALARALGRAAGTVGLLPGPDGEVVHDTSAAGTSPIGPLLARAEAQRAALAREAGAFPAPVVVPLPPLRELALEPVVQPDGTVAFAAESAAAQAATAPPAPGSVSLALPPGEAVAYWAGPPGTSGVLVVSPNASDEELRFGQAMAWVHHELPGLAGAQAQVLAALSVRSRRELVDPRLRRLVREGRVLLRHREAWRQVVRLLGRRLADASTAEELVAPLVASFDPRGGAPATLRFARAFNDLRFPPSPPGSPSARRRAPPGPA